MWQPADQTLWLGHIDSERGELGVRWHQQGSALVDRSGRAGAGRADRLCLRRRRAVTSFSVKPAVALSSSERETRACASIYLWFAWLLAA